MRTVLVIPSDTQNGSTKGLPPSDKPWRRDEGEDIVPSPAQRLLWQQWKECWHEAYMLKKQKRGTRLIVVNNGDAIDGNHHRTTEITTPKPEEQGRMHEAAMDWALKFVKFNHKDGDLIYYTEGTEAHSGPGHANEDAIARKFKGIVPHRKATIFKDGMPLDGYYLWPEVKLNINGVRFVIRHHGGSIGSRAWTKDNGMFILAKDTYWRALDTKQPIPDYKIWSHLHRFVSGRYVGRQGTVETFLTPCFQLHTKYVGALGGADPPSIGMLMFVIEEDGSVYWKCPRMIANTESEYVKV